MWLPVCTSSVGGIQVQFQPVVGSGLSTLLRRSLVASNSLFQAELNPVRFFVQWQLAIALFNSININLFGDFT
jgi:hypothetical protein